MKRSVLFLDIDGVLNSNIWNSSHAREITEGTLVDEEKIRMLARLVHRTRTEIVLHSGWRFWFDARIHPIRPEAKKFADMLAKEGLKISGMTPDLTTEEIRRTRRFSLVKAQEILTWLSMQEGVGNWIVLDDLELHNEQVARHQVKPDQTVGLTEEDVLVAEKRLLGELVPDQIE